MANRNDDSGISRVPRVRAVMLGERTPDGNAVPAELESLRREEQARADRGRREEHVRIAAFGPDGPPGNYDPGVWNQPAYLWALERWTEGVRRTPAEYRSWLLDQIRGVIGDTGLPPHADPRRQLDPRSLEDDRAWLVDAVSGLGWRGEPVPLVGYVARVVAAARDRSRDSSDRWDDERTLDRLALTELQQFWFLTRAAAHEDPEVRRVGVKPLAHFARYPIMAEGVAATLAPLLDDPDDEVRRWALVQFAALAPHTPGVAARFWATADWSNDDPNYEHYRSQCFEVFGPQEWAAAGPAALPLLVLALRHWSHDVWRSAMSRLGGIGRKSAAVFCRLEELATDEAVWEDIRETARDLLWDLTAHGTDPGPLEAEEAFLLRVWENPADETLKLVYADWLEDHGRSEAAVWVRSGIELARTPEGSPRRQELADYPYHWSPGPRPSDVAWAELWDRLCARSARPSADGLAS